jgi:glycogen synthase
MASSLLKNFKNSNRVLSKMSTFRPDEWKDKPLVVAVTRAVRQKASILLEALDGSSSVLHELLKRDLYLVVLGTGELENQLEEINH